MVCEVEDIVSVGAGLFHNTVRRVHVIDATLVKYNGISVGMVLAFRTFPPHIISSVMI